MTSTYLKPSTTCITRDKEITFISANLVPIGENRNFYHQACKEYNDLDKNIKSTNHLASFHTALLKSP
jgi:hypothetical protein